MRRVQSVPIPGRLLMRKPRLIEELRALPPRTILGIAAGHAVLLAGVLWGGVPYVLMQGLLAAELVIVNLATIALYPQRGWRKHLWDTAKLVGILLFLLFFLVVTFGIASEGESGNALAVGVAGLRDLTGGTALWMLAYIVVHLGVALWQAFQSTDPRRIWAQQTLAGSATTFIAMFLMVFVAAFLGIPMSTGLRSMGVELDASALLGALMVLLRFGLALVVATMPAKELDAIAANPYLT